MKEKFSESQWDLIRLVAGVVESAFIICFSAILFIAFGGSFISGIIGSEANWIQLKFLNNLLGTNPLGDFIMGRSNSVLIGIAGFAALVLFILVALFLLALNIWEYKSIKKLEK